MPLFTMKLRSNSIFTPVANNLDLQAMAARGAVGADSREFQVRPLKGIPTMAKLILRSLRCDEPATSFGDDIEIFVDGRSAGGQFGIDQGQTKDLALLDPHEFPVDEIGETVTFQFTEDTDPAAQFDRPATLGKHHDFVRVKEDGRYQLFWKILA
jgi:hypothetical protein